MAVLVALALTATTVVVLRSWFTGPDCQVASAGRAVVELSRTEAEAVTTAVTSRGIAARTAVRRAAPDLSAREVVLVARAVTGQHRAALSCRDGGADSSEADGLGANGLTARAERVRTDVQRRFGDLPLGGFAPGGVRSGHMPGSAHYEGRAIDLFFRPITAANKTRGWALAQYLVAHARRLAVQTVIFDGRIWTARRDAAGWREYRVSHARRSATTIAILEHRDHVHVDVTD